MRRLYLFLFLLVYVEIVGFAAWDSDYSSYRVLDSVVGDNVDYMHLRPFLCNNGNIVQTWIRPEVRISEEGEAYRSLVLRMQVFDADGRITLGEHGVEICNQHTRSSINEFAVDVLESGDMVAIYPDARNCIGKEDKYSRMYLYRYDQKGQSVWDKAGILFRFDDMGDDIAEESIDHVSASLCVNDSLIYVAVKVEHFISSQDRLSEWHMMVYDTLGNALMSEPVVIKTNVLTLRRAPGGGVYVIHSDATGLIFAKRYNSRLEDMWGRNVQVENTNVGPNFQVLPRIEYAGDGALAFSYRKLKSTTGYIVMNYMTSDGEVFKPAKVGTVTDEQSADGTSPMIGVNGDRILMCWLYWPSKQEAYLAMNMFDVDGNVVMDDSCGNEIFPGEPTRGHYLEHKKSEYSFGTYSVFKIIPRVDGWIVLYGSYTDHMDVHANLWMVKLDMDGKIVARQQIGTGVINISSAVESGSRPTAVIYDDRYAYIFNRQAYFETSDVKEISQVQVRCVDISDTEGWTATDEPIETIITDIPVIRNDEVSEDGLYRIYTIDGKSIGAVLSGSINIIRMQDGKGQVVVKKVLKSN